jgi:hypothetical protein
MAPSTGAARTAIEKDMTMVSVSIFRTLVEYGVNQYYIAVKTKLTIVIDITESMYVGFKNKFLITVPKERGCFFSAITEKDFMNDCFFFAVLPKLEEFRELD